MSNPNPNTIAVLGPLQSERSARDIQMQKMFSTCPISSENYCPKMQEPRSQKDQMLQQKFGNSGSVENFCSTGGGACGQQYAQINYNPYIPDSASIMFAPLK